jgi:hypothetical protein
MLGVIVTAVILKFERPPSSFVVAQIPQVSPPKPEEIPLANRLLAEVNAKVAPIRSFACEDVRIKIWEKGMRFKLTGRLYCEKPRNFRFLVRSSIAEELDLGSNSEVFWFWSRKNKTPGLFYAAHEDYYRTRLKTPFNPIWVKDSMGFSELAAFQTLKETDSDWIFINQTKNAAGQPVLQGRLVEKATQYFRAIVLADSAGKVLASAEVRDRTNGLPYHILYSWYEEGGHHMEIELNNLLLNVSTDPSLWKIPRIEPSIDMASQ